MAIVIYLEDYRRRLRLESPPLQPAQTPTNPLHELTLDERMFDAERLPFASGLPTAFLDGRWP